MAEVLDACSLIEVERNRLWGVTVVARLHEHHEWILRHPRKLMFRYGHNRLSARDRTFFSCQAIRPTDVAEKFGSESKFELLPRG